MNWKRELAILAALVAVFAAAYAMPTQEPRFNEAVQGSLALTKWYAREHVLLCLVPAFFIAGAISVFVSQAAVMKYLGVGANKVLAYGVAAVSGTILAVCSCTVLPLFAGIWKRGAGLGPATAFLYSGPAINVLAIILTARVLGFELGVARAVGAIVFSVAIGLLMYLIYRKEERARAAAAVAMPEPEQGRPLWKTALFFAAMIGILVFANWSKPQGVMLTVIDKWGDTMVYNGVVEKEDADFVYLRGRYRLPSSGGPEEELHVFPRSENVLMEPAPGPWRSIYEAKWYITGFLAMALALMLALWFRRGELGEWLAATWGFTKQIAPLLLGGVLVSGFLLGGPDHRGLLPAEWISDAVGGNSLGANLFASVAGALMYFATLTEVPILRGLLDGGMGQGPALALLLAGPSLSLPSMLVLASVMGTRKMLVYVSLVVVMATITGMTYGMFLG
jgi:uncharacterized protein